MAQQWNVDDGRVNELEDQCKVSMRKEKGKKKWLGKKLSQPIYPSIGKWINYCSVSIKWNVIQCKLLRQEKTI